MAHFVNRCEVQHPDTAESHGDGAHHVTAHNLRGREGSNNLVMFRNGESFQKCTSGCYYWAIDLSVLLKGQSCKIISHHDVEIETTKFYENLAQISVSGEDMPALCPDNLYSPQRVLSCLPACLCLVPKYEWHQNSSSFVGSCPQGQGQCLSMVSQQPVAMSRVGVGVS